MGRQQFVVVGAGQVGSALARGLAARGPVTVVSRNAVSLPAGARHVARDISIDNLDDVVVGAHTVFLAVNTAYSAAAWARTLPLMQARVADAAARAGARLVVLENLYMHGPSKQALGENQPFSASSAKGAVRARMAEELMARAGRQRVASVRPPDFWGPGLSSALVDDKAVRGLLQGKPLWVFGDPDATHARAWVDDVAATMIAIALSDDPAVWGRAWHPPVVHASNRDLVAALAGAAGIKNPGVRVMPRWLMGVLGVFVPVLKELREMLYQWDQPYLVDDSAARARFGLKPVGVADGARAIVAAARA
jgi:nucleoside-diphosphate-sugar epimerase